MYFLSINFVVVVHCYYCYCSSVHFSVPLSLAERNLRNMRSAMQPYTLSMHITVGFSYSLHAVLLVKSVVCITYPNYECRYRCLALLLAATVSAPIAAVVRCELCAVFCNALEALRLLDGESTLSLSPSLCCSFHMNMMRYFCSLPLVLVPWHCSTLV